jgi:hypothetical protein
LRQSLVVWTGLYIRSQYPAFALAVREGCYPTEIANALPLEGRSEGRRKLNVWTRPREREAVEPCSRSEARRSPSGLLVNMPGSRQAAHDT